MQLKSPFPTIRDFPQSLARRIADAMLNLIYPESCVVCGCPLACSKDCGVCDECWSKLIRLRLLPPWCPSCGLPLPSPADDDGYLCGSCLLKMPPFAGARSFGYYASELSFILQRLKFDGRQNIAHLTAPLLASAFVESWKREDVDVIVPIPLHPKRKRERGFNQALLLGRGLSNLIAVPLQENALVRIRHTMPQVGLGDPERFRNLKSAFLCKKPAMISGKRVLLVDDVMTTGATVSSACEALLRGGALRVSVLTVARAIAGQL